ncbi:MAG: hypothetical protein Roseis3KO_49280 [Roseivirga sp.]
MKPLAILLSLWLALTPQENSPTSLKFEGLTLQVELEETWNKPGYFTKIHSDTIIVKLGLMGQISGQRYTLEPDKSVKSIAIFQNYETSLTLMDEGPHIDLVNWKHHKSDWKRLELEDNHFSTLKYSRAQNAMFPDVTTDEILSALRDHLNVENNRWTELAKQCSSANSYPCGVSISSINLKIELTKVDGTTSLKHKIFEVPMGC